MRPRTAEDGARQCAGAILEREVALTANKARVLAIPEAPGTSTTREEILRNKFWLQSIKKLHGCLAYTPIDGVCFAVDSDSFLLRHSLCHAAEAYMLHDQKTVLMATHRFASDCGQREFVEASRTVLGRPRGEQFGEGYMMSVYHWLWEANDLHAFVRDGLREPRAHCAPAACRLAQYERAALFG